MPTAAELLYAKIDVRVSIWWLMLRIRVRQAYWRAYWWVFDHA